MLRTQEDDSIMCGFYCTAFKENMLNQNIDYIKLFSPSDYKKNDKVIYKYFKQKKWQKKAQALILD